MFWRAMFDPFWKLHFRVRSGRFLCQTVSAEPERSILPNFMVPMEGLEPPRSHEHQILSLARLPIPPRRQPNSNGAYFGRRELIGKGHFADLTKEIAIAQRVVEKSLRSINRFAHELSVHPCCVKRSIRIMPELLQRSTGMKVVQV